MHLKDLLFPARIPLTKKTNLARLICDCSIWYSPMAVAASFAAPSRAWIGCLNLSFTAGFKREVLVLHRVAKFLVRV